MGTTTDKQPRLLLTVEEAAERLNIGRTLTYALLKAGKLESVQIGRVRRVPTAAVQSFIEALRACADRDPEAA